MFDAKAQESLGYYVYALFDSGAPADARWPFYVGKGRGNRVFAHAAGEPPPPSEPHVLGPKLRTISEIKASGRKVIHLIVRYALTEEEAFRVEASLIDLLEHIRPGSLTNAVFGHGVVTGLIDCDDLAVDLNAKPLVTDVPLLVIKIEHRWRELHERYGAASRVPEVDIYEVTMGHWRISERRAAHARCVLAVARGIVRAVFVPTGWTTSLRPGRKMMTGRGDATAWGHFLHTSVAHLTPAGARSPILYVNC